MREKVRAARWPGRAHRVLLGLAGATLALAALEGGVWLIHAVIGGKPRLLRSDPQLGWSNRPDLRVRRQLDGGPAWDVTLDGLGRRTLGLAPLPGAPHLVALGDSFVFGDGVGPSEHFLHEVGVTRELNVVNLAVVGYSTDQEWLALAAYRGACDVLLLGTYLTNDLAGNLSHSGGHLLRFKPKFVPDETGALHLVPVRHPHLNRARHASYLATLGLGGLHRVAPSLALFDPPPPDAGTAPDSPAWARYVALVDRIVDEAERRGTRQVLILLWSYHSSRPDPAAAPALEARYSGRAVRIVDIDRVVAERGLDPATLYYAPAVDPGAHWTAAGHALVAGIVNGALAERPEPTPDAQSSR